MRITSAMIADGAQVQGGKLYVLGGAFDTIHTRTFPVTHRGWSLALVAEVEQGDRQRDLPIQIVLVDEDEGPPLLEAEARLRVGAPPTLRPGDVSIVPIAMPLPDVTFPAEKGYAFRIRYRDQELARVQFRVTPAASPTV